MPTSLLPTLVRNHAHRQKVGLVDHPHLAALVVRRLPDSCLVINKGPDGKQGRQVERRTFQHLLALLHTAASENQSYRVHQRKIERRLPPIPVLPPTNTTVLPDRSVLKHVTEGRRVHWSTTNWVSSNLPMIVA